MDCLYWQERLRPDEALWITRIAIRYSRIAEPSEHECPYGGDWSRCHAIWSKARSAVWNRTESYLLRKVRLEEAKYRGTHSQIDWIRLVAYCRGVCPRCMNPSDRMTRDHIVRIVDGGDDTIGNIQPLCDTCNYSKGKEPFDWMAFRGWRPEQAGGSQ